MLEYRTEDIRNIALIGHGDAGKTTLSEGILFAAKETKRFGSVTEGTTVSDYNTDEIERKISISASLLHCFWKNKKINILDTPGYMDFTGEVISSLQAVEIGAIVVNTVSGIEVGTEIVWRYCEKRSLPRIFIINKLNKEHSNFQKVADAITKQFSNKAIPVQIPVNEGVNFDSIVDILTMKVIKGVSDKSGAVTIEPLPDNLKNKIEDLHLKLKENVAESDDILLEKYLEEGDISEEELKNTFKKAIADRKIFPILVTSAELNYGVNSLLDFITEYCPSPKELGKVTVKKPRSEEKIQLEYEANGYPVLQIFKTVSEQHVGELAYFKCISGTVKPGMDLLNTNCDQIERIGQIFSLNGNTRKETAHIIAGDIGAVVKLKNSHTSDTLCAREHPVMLEPIEFPSPVISIAVVPKAKGDEEKISGGLQMLHEEDPSFVIKIDNELQQIIVSGQGELHLDIVIKRLKQKSGVEVIKEDPKIPYRETIKGKSKAQGRYKKQSGGRGQFGDAWIEIEPLEKGKGFEFVNSIFGGSIPAKYIPAVEKGIADTCAEGVLAGYPIIDLQVTLIDGSYHTVDSSELAFKIAGSLGFKKAFTEASPILLEPIYDVEVTIPEEFMGDVMGDLSSRRGKIQGMESEGNFQRIKARVPLAELNKYSTVLRSITSGRGLHLRKFYSYEEVPYEIAQKIVQEHSSKYKQREETE